MAAEASQWGLEMVSPPLKRANSLPVSQLARWLTQPCCCSPAGAPCLPAFALPVPASLSPAPAPHHCLALLLSQPLQAGLEQRQQAGKPGGGRAKISDRVALLKKALVAETAAAAAAAGAPCAPRAAVALLAGPEAPTAEDADAISALFELSASQ